MDWNRIKDLTVKNAVFNTKEITFQFNDSDLKLVLLAKHECCSISRFKQVSPPDILVGQKIIKLHLSPDDEQVEDVTFDGMVTRCCKFFIKTESGIKCSITLLNESNGYYTGWIEPHIV